MWIVYSCFVLMAKEKVQNMQAYKVGEFFEMNSQLLFWSCVMSFGKEEVLGGL